MSLERWKKLRLVKEIKNPWWTYRTEEFELPSGKIPERGKTGIHSCHLRSGMTLAAWLIARKKIGK